MSPLPLAEVSEKHKTPLPQPSSHTWQCENISGFCYYLITEIRRFPVGSLLPTVGSVPCRELPETQSLLQGAASGTHRAWSGQDGGLAVHWGVRCPSAVPTAWMDTAGEGSVQVAGVQHLLCAGQSFLPSDGPISMALLFQLGRFLQYF